MVMSMTVCMVCGGSGTLEVVELLAEEDGQEVEEIECENCAGSGWEPATE